jgi:hypothetical protein
VCSNLVHGEVYWIQHYVIKVVSGFLRVLRFPPPIKLTLSFRWLGLWCLMPPFSNISVISWRSVFLGGETGVPGENHRPVASYWQTFSHNTVSGTPPHYNTTLQTLNQSDVALGQITSFLILDFIGCPSVSIRALFKNSIESLWKQYSKSVSKI